MDHLENILKLAENEFDAVSKNGKFRSRDEIDSVYKLIDIVKDIYCIWNYEDDDEDMYSRGGGYPMYDGHSYARGRGRYAKRDSMGRYSREGNYRGMYGTRYSRDGKEEYIEKLHDMMNTAPDDQTRQSIQRMIDNM